ncbi:hypothetical protein H4R18_003658 [Coemansia javaensis]|uniref:Uncharacterized protein n=1 Tax=Coemansia javaensis TaxID=2761396 RepID=A0A9W8HBD1_9FUNG|nr:hypothetical protein H4R18_003658 [Coemansia javaensis]
MSILVPVAYEGNVVGHACYNTAEERFTHMARGARARASGKSMTVAETIQAALKSTHIAKLMANPQLFCLKAGSKSPILYSAGGSTTLAQVFKECKSNRNVVFNVVYARRAVDVYVANHIVASVTVSLVISDKFDKLPGALARCLGKRKEDMDKFFFKHGPTVCRSTMSLYQFLDRGAVVLQAHLKGSGCKMA